MRVRLLFGFYLLLVPATARAEAQRGDSLSVLNAARHAQSAFERTRRHNIPIVDDQDDPQHCEVEIGRMCYWQAGSDDKPVAEPRSITQARLELIARLTRLNALSPRDSWISGQLVRYMVESGEDSAARAVVRTCASVRWYCKALEGYVLHEAEDYAGAAAAFDSALADMPAAERCRWNDISLLLNDDERVRYERIPCGQRDSVERMFWQLARPSFVVNGNDRRTEHFSRVVLADLCENTENAYDMNWGADMREMLIRYGPPGWYTKGRMQSFQSIPMPVGHSKSPSFHFAADIDGDSVHWDAYAPIARERYAPPYMDTLTQLDVQFAMLKRGDSALVVAVYANPVADSAADRAFLGVSGVARDSGAADTTEERVRRVRTAWKGMMVAMETFNPTSRIDARAREWLEPPPHARGAPDVSTLLLFSADSGAPAETLDDVLRHALTNNELRGAHRLGLYWEVYGDDTPATPAPTMPDSSPDTTVTRETPADDSASVVVTVVRTDGGVMRWLGQALHLTSKDSPLAVRWHDVRDATGVAAHSVSLDLSQLPRGNYRVSVAMGTDPEHRTEVARDIRLR
jgi:hypothetical protein